MKKYRSLDEANRRIEELENEISSLKAELECYKNKKTSGRKKHNDKWMSSYQDFVVSFESGMTLIEIADKNNISKRTVYRYKEYYDKTKGNG
ncbi:MAG: resolvase [Saccharofermentans sp.]|nr:resolvase [Saccharofermentans sp.]